MTGEGSQLPFLGLNHGESFVKFISIDAELGAAKTQMIMGFAPAATIKMIFFPTTEAPHVECYGRNYSNFQDSLRNKLRQTANY